MDQISENKAAILNNTDQIKENGDDIRENTLKCLSIGVTQGQRSTFL